MLNMQKSPIFIIGCPRSGTTLLRVMLDSHPNIYCGPETHLIPKLKIFYDSLDENWDFLQSFGLTKEDFNKKISEIFSYFPEHNMKLKNKIRWAEKTPEHLFFAEFIDQLFPQCKFINMIRDGRDVVTSFKKRWGSKTIPYATKKWNKSMEKSYELRNTFDSNRYIEIKYENLVNNPEEITKKIMTFLNETWSQVLLEHQKQDHDYHFNLKTGENIDQDKEKNPTRHSPSKPIFKSSIGRWKNDLNIFEKAYSNTIMSKNLKKMGYK